MLHSKSEKNCKNERSSKKYSHGKRFTGPVECTFNNPAPSFFARRPYWIAHDLTKNVELWVPLENVFLPKTVHSTKLLKHFQKEVFFIEEVLLGKQSASVTNLHKETCQMSETNFPRVQNKCWKLNFFKKKDIFPLNIPNVQKIPKYFYNEMFRSKKILFSRKFFRKCRVQFRQPWRKNPSTSKNVSLRSESHVENVIIQWCLEKNIFLLGKFSRKILLTCKI